MELDGRRVRVMLLNRKKVDFEATLVGSIRNSYILTECPSNHSGKRIFSETSPRFGECDYYEVVDYGKKYQYITYEEFERFFEDRGFEYKKEFGYVTVSKDDLECVDINLDILKQIDNSKLGFDKLTNEEQGWLADLSWQLACTPIEYRREINPLFHVRAFGLDPEYNYVKEDLVNGEYVVSDSCESRSHKAKFTQEEYDRMPPEFKTESYKKEKVEK